MIHYAREESTCFCRNLTEHTFIRWTLLVLRKLWFVEERRPSILRPVQNKAISYQIGSMDYDFQIGRTHFNVFEMTTSPDAFIMNSTSQTLLNNARSSVTHGPCWVCTDTLAWELSFCNLWLSGCFLQSPSASLCVSMARYLFHYPKNNHSKHSPGAYLRRYNMTRRRMLDPVYFVRTLRHSVTVRVNSLQRCTMIEKSCIKWQLWCLYLVRKWQLCLF